MENIGENQRNTKRRNDVFEPKTAYLLGNKQDERNQKLVPCVLLHLWAELRRQIKKETEGKAQIGEYRYNIVFATKGTYHGRTRCVSGPPRAADLSAFTEGCSHAMVGAQLWLWRRTAARKTTTAMAWDCGEISGSGGRCVTQLTM